VRVIDALETDVLIKTHGRVVQPAHVQVYAWDVRFSQLRKKVQHQLTAHAVAARRWEQIDVHICRVLRQVDLPGGRVTAMKAADERSRGRFIPDGGERVAMTKDWKPAFLTLLVKFSSVRRRDNVAKNVSPNHSHEAVCRLESQVRTDVGLANEVRVGDR
jgi:hypothetical protein